MSEWYDRQKKPSRNFRKLLQERIDKTNPRRTLTAEEQRRLSKLVLKFSNKGNTSTALP